VPIVNYLHARGASIFVCAHGAAFDLMQLECPYAHFVEDVPFELNYSKSERGNLFKLIAQLPKMWLHIYREHHLIKKLVTKYHINLIISDARYGLYHHSVPCIFITHQLNIKVPFAEKLVNFLNHYFIKKFNACWVPDFENNALAGDLSKKNKLKNIRYIGPQSRAQKVNITPEKNAAILYLLSGIEPQRSILEQLIINYHTKNPHQAILIRGTYHAQVKIVPQSNLIVYNMCDAKQLQNLVASCKYIICRSGYSSIMDLLKWQKNAVLIPTPGQYEQEYLAQFLSEKKWFYTMKQNEFTAVHDDIFKTYQCPMLEQSEINFEQLIDDLK
jgi:uncharacterized protein (TIGR00661 family)